MEVEFKNLHLYYLISSFLIFFQVEDLCNFLVSVETPHGNYDQHGVLTRLMALSNIQMGKINYLNTENTVYLETGDDKKVYTSSILARNYREIVFHTKVKI